MDIIKVMSLFSLLPETVQNVMIPTGLTIVHYDRRLSRRIYGYEREYLYCSQKLYND